MFEGEGNNTLLSHSRTPSPSKLSSSIKQCRQKCEKEFHNQLSSLQKEIAESDETSTDALLLTNSSTRIRSRDAFMLMALWMERYPYPQPLTNAAKPTGCVLVTPQERIISLQHNGEAHAIVRALLFSNIDPRGCDIYVSRFPCALCTKIMIQANIRKCYYFPASEWEMHSDPSQDSSSPLRHHGGSPTKTNRSASPIKIASAEDLEEARSSKNKISISRLIQNNTTALTLYIPQWDHAETLNPTPVFEQFTEYWHLDQKLGTSPGIASRWPTILSKFRRTMVAISRLQKKYDVSVRSQTINEAAFSPLDLFIEGSPKLSPPHIRHAIILAHIAARRTDDPKVGVGAIIMKRDASRYISVGWNGYPKKSQHLDYPSKGADDSVEDEELKYDYILHAEQNALLWRSPPGCDLSDAILISTKMPCDECSPMVYDSGIRTIYSNRQSLKSADDPARFRGLSYDNCNLLIKEVYVFDQTT